MSLVPHQFWPPFGLLIECGSLSLSPVRDSDLPALAALAYEGIHDAAAMPFDFPWTAGTPDEVRLRLLQFHWGRRAAMTPASWQLESTVRFEGKIVGCQGISTSDYLVTRTGETGSWLGAKYHGRGIGTLMRQTLCAFMFDHLDAAEVTSAAFTDNPASLAVSRKVGYQKNGVVRRRRREGEMALRQQLTLTTETLNRSDQELRVKGVPQLREFLGLESV
ncbi:N-acetyltransferase [Cryobacterium frigoriphilum]|uniref:N-acetyltransferase n=1 Tax=Cryobacterium frigoriphilum TaxID=1259150 RepID=A0A4R9ABP0_9MICO|nr:GNAT family N-acetyltransferase [Cryobacterium frigoriphilum]TFD55748.1 N-acetyltransferase [Cryobacterium frigoriphilum]